MVVAESRELSAASAEWQADFRMSRWVSAAGVILNIGLVLVATRLVYADMRRRARQTTNLRDQKQELEQQVDQRTRELTALSTHLQGVSEQEKSALSRELHDELGGLLVAARMDLSWLQQRLPTSDPGIEQRFKRIHESLSAGVDLKRRVVEELRPTLLDNMGLFAALRWQFKETCRRAGLECTESIPEIEPKFNPDAAIGVFRIAQEALTNILKHAEAKSADLAIVASRRVNVTGCRSQCVGRMHHNTVELFSLARLVQIPLQKSGVGNPVQTARKFSEMHRAGGDVYTPGMSREVSRGPQSRDAFARA
jgi:signal transduction histidine kinase